MRSFIVVSALVAAAFAQDSSSAQTTASVDEHPQTSFLQQTDSNGVVTGQPAVATSQPSQPAADNSQPALVTSQPLPFSIPAQYDGVTTVVIPLGRNSTTQVVVSANNSTTVILDQPQTTGAGTFTGKPKPSGTDSEGNPTGTGSSGSQESGKSGDKPGSAASLHMAAGAVGAGLLAAFL